MLPNFWADNSIKRRSCYSFSFLKTAIMIFDNSYWLHCCCCVWCSTMDGRSRYFWSTNLMKDMAAKCFVSFDILKNLLHPISFLCNTVIGIITKFFSLDKLFYVSQQMHSTIETIILGIALIKTENGVLIWNSRKYYFYNFFCHINKISWDKVVVSGIEIQKLIFFFVEIKESPMVAGTNRNKQFCCRSLTIHHKA